MRERRRNAAQGFNSFQKQQVNKLVEAKVMDLQIKVSIPFNKTKSINPKKSSLFFLF